MSVSDTIPIQLHDCQAYLEGTVIHIRPKTMDRLLSEVAPSQDSPSSNEPSNHSEPELHEDYDSPGQMIRDAEQTQQQKMTQFGQSQFYALADFTHNVIDSALADSVTTVPIYTAKTSTLISVAQTQVDTSTTMTATTTNLFFSLFMESTIHLFLYLFTESTFHLFLHLFMQSIIHLLLCFIH